MYNNLYDAPGVRKIDSIAINDYKIPGYELMQRAGIAAFKIITQHHEGIKELAVFAGPGNNGGDGSVIAKSALEFGLKVTFIKLGDFEALQGDAKTAYQELKDQAAIVDNYVEFGFAEFINELNQKTVDFAPEVIVDAMLGTGLTKLIKGEIKDAIDFINATDINVLAIDVPTGLNANTGRVMGLAIQARATVTFIALKQGLFTANARDYVGRIFLEGLDVSDNIKQNVTPTATLLNWHEVLELLPKRTDTAHKGDCGHVLIIGGFTGMHGAPRLSATAAFRAGAGMVSVVTHPDNVMPIVLEQAEIMCHGFMPGNKQQEQNLANLINKADVIAIGPGLGTTDWGQALLTIAAKAEKPKVVDADALNILSTAKLEISNIANTVFTPHPGEAARLLGVDTEYIEEDRFNAIAALVGKYPGVFVLKGAGTITKQSDKLPAICPAGNSGMATAGMGDVLTGVIAALMGQGLSAQDAANLGVFIHALAADSAMTDGKNGMMPSDLFAYIRLLVDI